MEVFPDPACMVAVLLPLPSIEFSQCQACFRFFACTLTKLYNNSISYPHFTNGEMEVMDHWVTNLGHRLLSDKAGIGFLVCLGHISPTSARGIHPPYCPLPAVSMRPPAQSLYPIPHQGHHRDLSASDASGPGLTEVN